MTAFPTRTLVACLAASLSAQSTLADTISLKSSVRLSNDDHVITLSDIADLEGEHARAFADLPISSVQDINAVMELSVREIRAKLDEAGAHWGRINLNGKTVVIRAGRSATAAPPLAMAPISIKRENAAPTSASTDRDELLAGELANSPTLRGTIAHLIASNLRINPNDLRLGFEAADAEFLDSSVANARFEVQPLSSFASDRIELKVRTWADGVVQQSRGVSVIPQLRVDGAALRQDMLKDQMITDVDVVNAEQWLSPGQANQHVGRLAAIGRLASKSLKAGEVLREADLRRDALIKRGDLTLVRCLVGGAVISLQAEARADGAQGQTIEFRKQGERDTFLATVSARGEAVVDLSRR